MSLDKNLYTVRKAVVTTAIEAMEMLPDCEKVHITVAVCDPKAADQAPLWDAPMSKVSNGFITLNVAQAATGYRLFKDDFLHISTRFDGQDTQLFIPYSLIVSIAGLNPGMQPVAFENLVPFGYLPEHIAPQPSAPRSTQDNIVPVTFGKKR